MISCRQRNSTDVVLQIAEKSHSASLRFQNFHWGITLDSQSLTRPSRPCLFSGQLSCPLACLVKTKKPAINLDICGKKVELHVHSALKLRELPI